MSEFPRLKTGAVLQYPATKGLSFTTQVHRFLDGTEQRFRDRGVVLRRWIVSLRHLTEGEFLALDDFYRTNQGQTGTFSFFDPWEEVTYESCSLESEEVLARFLETGDCRIDLVVSQNRS
ncbi:MAG: hypothetical protein FJW20_02450 [Acidimicrobiia bacterium]|nr:hypothetical protein [Acidimicrobiia bacterium]